MKLTPRQIGRIAEHIEANLKKYPIGHPNVQDAESDSVARLQQDPELPPYEALDPELLNAIESHLEQTE